MPPPNTATRAPPSTSGLNSRAQQTTRRGLYSGATRGTDDNRILVVTESHDLSEARDILERVLASDRADVPATAQRRQLAQLDRAREPGELEPRCQIPDWLHDLGAAVSSDLVDAERESARAAFDRAALVEQLTDARQKLLSARRALELDPRWRQVQEARTEVEAARRRWWTANHEVLSSQGRQRRAARRDSDAARRDLDKVIAQAEKARAGAAPAQATADVAAARVHQIETSIRSSDILDRWTDSAARVHELRELSNALDDWQRWASGQRLAPARVAHLTAVLASDTATRYCGCTALTEPIEGWAHDAGIVLRPARAPERSAPTLEIEI